MSILLASCMTDTTSLAKWQGLWQQRTSSQWRRFASSVVTRAEDLGLEVDSQTDVLGRFEDSIELSVRLELSGSRSDMLMLAHLVAKTYNQYAVRVLHDGGHQRLLTASVKGIAEGVRLLEAIDIPASLGQEFIEVDVITDDRARMLLPQLPHAQVRPVEVLRVSGESYVSSQGRQILLRPL